jgi:hypothetical protein
LGNPLDAEGTHDPWAKYKWWILSGLAVLLAAGAGLLLRKPTTSAAVAAVGPQPVGPIPPAPLGTRTHSEQLLQSLKEELFALETDHLQHRISDEDYVAQKAALELVLRRALQRANPTAHTPELISR